MNIEFTQTNEGVELKTPDKDVTELLADSRLTDQEKEAIVDAYDQDREALFWATRNVLKNFINTDYRKATEDLVGKEGIEELQEWLWLFVDGLYGPGSFRAVIDFQKENWLSVTWVINEQVLQKIRELKGVENNKEKEKFDIEKMENFNEVISVVAHQILQQYIWKLDSPEWVSLDPDKIYQDIVDIFEGIETNLDQDNIFLKNIQIIKENFFGSEEKWVQMIKFAIAKIISNENAKENVSEDLSDYYLFFRSSVATLIDMSQNSSKESFDNYLEEFQKVPQIKNMLESFPDLENIFINILPSIVNSLDKEEFLGLLDSFFETSNDDMKIIIDAELSEDKENIDKKAVIDSKLNIINGIGKILYYVVDSNKDNLDQIVDSISKLDLVKGNDIFKESLELLKDKNISNEDKYTLATKTLQLLDTITNSSYDKDTQNNMIDDYLTYMLQFVGEKGWVISEKWSTLISNIVWVEEVNKDKQLSDYILDEVKKDYPKIVRFVEKSSSIMWMMWDTISDSAMNLFDKVMWKNTDKNENEEKSVIQEVDYSEALDFATDNFGTILSVLKAYMASEGFDSFTQFLLEDESIKNGLLLAWSETVNKIRSIIELDITQVINQAREKILVSFEWWQENSQDLQKIPRRSNNLRNYRKTTSRWRPYSSDEAVRKSFTVRAKLSLLSISLK